MQLPVSSLIVEAEVTHALSGLTLYSVIIPHTQSQGVGGEAFSVDGLRDPQRIIGLPLVHVGIFYYFECHENHFHLVCMCFKK